MFLYRLFFVLCLLPISLGVIASSAEKQIEKRISPVGQVCIAGQECADNSPTLTSDIIRTGKEVYESACKTCHSIGLAGAPTFGEKLTWGNRPEQGLELLLQNVVNGLNGMPPMGLCMDCNEDELRSSVKYMLDELN